jgi:hypothetical protein
MQNKTVLFLALITGLLTACSNYPRPSNFYDITRLTSYSILEFPPYQFDVVIWKTDGAVVAFQEKHDRIRNPYGIVGDNKLHYLDLGKDANCNLTTWYYLPTQLPDGRLGLLKMCATDNAFTDKKYMIAYDWDTAEFEQIVRKPLKSFPISGCFSWNPSMTKGIQSVNNGLVGTLNWLTQVGPEAVHITLRDENRIWDLAKDYEEDGSREGGTLSCPAWSPKGNEIAVFVSFDAMGIEGISRLDKQMKLVLISPETGASEVVLLGVFYPKALQWSPGAKQIAFIGYVENGSKDYQGNEPNGVWIFDVETKALSLIARGGYFRDLSWAPDSKEIAVIWCDGAECDRSEIRKYTLPE